MDKVDATLAELIAQGAGALSAAVVQYGEASVELVLLAVWLEALVKAVGGGLLLVVTVLTTVFAYKAVKKKVEAEPYAEPLYMAVGFIGVLAAASLINFLHGEKWIMLLSPEAGLVLRAIEMLGG